MKWSFSWNPRVWFIGFYVRRYTHLIARNGMVLVVGDQDNVSDLQTPESTTLVGWDIYFGFPCFCLCLNLLPVEAPDPFKTAITAVERFDENDKQVCLKSLGHLQSVIASKIERLELDIASEKANEERTDPDASV